MPVSPPLPSTNIRLTAVSYLNTLPLVWGFLHGPQRGAAALDFALPSECSERLRRGEADVGLLPVIEAHRQGLPPLGDTGIACRGPVLSILLISKVPAAGIRSWAADRSSRTSVALTRVLLASHFQNPDTRVAPAEPDLDTMLSANDACLIIGDPALRLRTVQSAGLHIYDLGEEWWKLTSLPMVFACWSGSTTLDPSVFRESLDFGRQHLDDIVSMEAAQRSIPEPLARQYLTRHIVYDIGAQERRGWAEYLKMAAILEEVPA